MSYKPTAEEVQLIRKAVGLTQAEAGKRIFSSRLAWQKWELGERQMPASSFLLFLLKHRLIDPELITENTKTQAFYALETINTTNPEILERIASAGRKNEELVED